MRLPGRRNHTAILPTVVALLLSLSFVFMGVWVRMMAGSFGTWQQIYLRILLASLICLVVFRRQLGWKFWSSITRKEWIVYAVRMIMAYVVGVGFFTIAVQSTPLAVVSFVASLPIAGVLGWIMFRERIRPMGLVFVGLSVIGLALLTGIGNHGLLLQWGVVATIISLLGFDIGYLMSRHHLKKRTNYQNTAVLLTIGWVPLQLT